MVSPSFPLGIDIGGSGVKGAPVDLETGEFVADRLRIETPQPATPEAVADVVARVAEEFASYTGDSPVGVTIPGIVRGGIMRSAANIDKSWIGIDVNALFSERLGRPVSVLNDADAAGIAELHYGAAKGAPGTVLLATLGTGIGTALLVDGVLVPNTEFGHLEIDGVDAETRASAAVRDREQLKWPEWAARLQTYFAHVEMLLSPDLIVVGGGVSKKAHKFLPLLDLQTPIIPATLRNAAGIVGAAWFAVQATQH
ncbi:Polyphosphate glucokinase [Austwickia sp. TVS 96-490-7B]|uniref:polyphosphate--glucose phosphotransferase n=1 Tax=Austwickia sp. TVS 96-490-7B TaxID=2830843 RepID=UPI001C590486|nr:ROK family protein [Austwickia sp. TVS 96-490-7B]MBW3086424.1 Polyphosphate glucokinase [Austwickia sp. TVS 96-490-7B]